MARPKGTKYIETPEKMWELFVAYKESVKSNPRYVYEYHGKDGTQVRKPLEVPLTMEGFEEYVAELNIIQSLDQYFSNQDGLYDDYMGICSRVRKAIRRDQIEGGMVGQYNSSITQRLNGLTEKVEQTITTPPIFPDLD